MANNEVRLKSYKIYNTIDGKLEFVLISPNYRELKELNGLIRDGMKCVVTDQRSELVDKRFVD